MLGFGNKVGGISNEEEAQEFILFMQSNKGILKIIKDLNSQYPFNNTNKNYEFKFSFISDSIVILAYPLKLDNNITEDKYYELSVHMFMRLYNELLPLFLSLWEHEKILLRGGVSNKFSYIENEFIVGEGLIEAYKLESGDDNAIYPRIILSKNLTDNSKFMEHLQRLNGKLYKTGKNIITKDKKDNFFFLNYFNLLQNQEQPHLDNAMNIHISNQKFYDFHQKAIQEMKLFMNSKKGTKDYERIKAKYDWIKDYHNKYTPSEYKIIDK
jgi:hypothetical protein